MTWVIGLPGTVGGAIGLSDIRVTVMQDHTPIDFIDGIQKLHPVAVNMAVGFAGSVEAGLWAVEDIRHLLNGSPVHRLHQVLQGWADSLARHFREQNLQTMGLQLMVLAASTSEDILPGWERTFAFTLEAPSFDVVELPFGKASSIGSGSDPSLSVFVSALDELSRTWHQFGEFENLAPGWSGLPVLHGLSHWIKEHAPTPTVSHHLHLCMVRRHNTQIFTSDTSKVSGDMQSRMPEIATSLQEFKLLMVNRGYKGLAAHGYQGGIGRGRP